MATYEQLDRSDPAKAAERSTRRRDVAKVIDRAERRQHAQEARLGDHEMPKVRCQQGVDRPDLGDGPNQPRQCDKR